MFNKCKEVCKEYETECPNTECRQWIDFPNDLNCTLIAIDKNGPMKLEDVGLRLKITAARICQIEHEATEKLKKRTELLQVLNE